MSHSIPTSYKQLAEYVWGEQGEKWIKELPSIVEKCCAKWELEYLGPVEDLSFNFVSHVLQKKTNSPAILKIGIPKTELSTQIQCLEIFPKEITVKLLEKDLELGAFLLPKLDPGGNLAELQMQDDKEATKIAARLIHKIPTSIPKNSDFPTVLDWVDIMAQKRAAIIETNKLPISMLDKAVGLAKDLDASKAENKLLHGDLHHTNILYDEKLGWIVIDPKGVIGDPIFEAARLLSNPHKNLENIQDPESLLPERIEILSETLGCDSRRIIGWGYVDCVNVASWFGPENELLQPVLKIAKSLEEMISL